MSGMDRLTELLPCPFCGGEADTMTPEADDMRAATVMCMGCYCTGKECETEAQAIAAWNRRASQAAPAPQKPVAWAETDHKGKVIGVSLNQYPWHPTPLYASPAPSDVLRDHIRKMQSYVQEYLEPGSYVQKHGDQKGRKLLEWADKTSNIVQESQNEMRAAVLNDLIHMLDGPEEREALTPAPAQEGGE